MIMARRAKSIEFERSMNLHIFSKFIIEMEEEKKNIEKLITPNITNLLREKEKVFKEPIRTLLNVFSFKIILRESSAVFLFLLLKNTVITSLMIVSYLVIQSKYFYLFHWFQAVLNFLLLFYTLIQ